MKLNRIEIKIAQIIKTELEEMVENILSKHKRNQINRGNNPFNCFEDSYIKNYMGMGRSFDSQLGNRLQNIAFKLLSLSNHKVAPNRVILNIVGNILYMHCEQDNSLKQQIYIVKNSAMTPQAYSVEIDEQQIDFYSSLSKIYKTKNGQLGIPVDLLYLNLNKNGAFRAFEIKAGGNLDTKNADANYNEVIRLEKILHPFGNSKSFFATCYNNMGENEMPQGSIFYKLDKTQILIGKVFWNKVLPKDITYERFIEIYQYIFRDVVKVDAKLQVQL